MISRSTFLTIPNVLTMLRVVMIPFFIAVSLRQAYLVALILLVAAGVTDVIDGFVARRFNQRSTLGAVLDPAADKVMIFSGYLLYTFHELVVHRLPQWLTISIFVRDAGLVFFAYLLFTRTSIRRFPPSIAGKLSTLMQVVALSVTIAANTPLSALAIPLLAPVDKLALGVTLYSSFDYLRRADLRLKGDWSRQGPAISPAAGKPS